MPIGRTIRYHQTRAVRGRRLGHVAENSVTQRSHQIGKAAAPRYPLGQWMFGAEGDEGLCMRCAPCYRIHYHAEGFAPHREDVGRRSPSSRRYDGRPDSGRKQVQRAGVPSMHLAARPHRYPLW